MPLPIPTWNKGDKLSADKLRGLSENISSGRRSIRDPKYRSDHKHFRYKPKCIEFDFKAEFKKDPQGDGRIVPAWHQGYIRAYDVDVLVGIAEWNYISDWQEGEEIELYLNYETLPNGIILRAEVSKLPKSQVIHQPSAEPGLYSLLLASIDADKHIVQHWLGSAVHHWLALRNSDDRWGPPWDEAAGYSNVPGIGHVICRRDGQSWTGRRLAAGPNVSITENAHSIIISAKDGGGLELSVVPGPGIDVERSDGYTDDGTRLIRYDIKGRLSQYKNHAKPNEQGDITGISVYLNPSLSPRRDAAAYILDGHILISIVPGPITRVKAGANISVAESWDYEDGWPVLTYTVSTTKDGGELISIVPGPGIAVETTTGAMADGTPYVQHRISGLTARYGQPGEDSRQGDMTGAEIAIKPSFDPTPACLPSIIDGVLTVSIVPGPKTIVVAGDNVTVAETRSEVNGWPVLTYTVSAKSSGGGIVPGEASDPDRPPTGYNADQMRAFGWTKVTGYWADPTGHAHQCFMAVANGKLFFHMFPSEWSV